ncbi:MAG: hypothetical protein HRU15_11470 [Planctomycetes bacterium]|nr:hypothetical protein [Planctomycetota bacterium]
MLEQTAAHMSERLAVRFDKTNGNLLFLGIESGGRGTGHRDTNLLRSGAGFGICGAEVISAQGDDKDKVEAVVFENDSCRCLLRMSEDAWSLRFTAHEGKTLSGPLFTCATAPNITPTSLWAEPEHWQVDPDPMHGDPMQPQTYERSYHAPALISFPSYGVLQCTANKACRIKHTQRPSDQHSAYNLGFENFGGHNNRIAMHEGQFEYAFYADKDCTDIELSFAVVDEIIPQLDGIDLSEAKWDGLKRNWMNNFTLNPASLTLGDNPILSGCGHLAIHWKSDIAMYTPEFIGDLRVQKFFRQALKITFTEQLEESGKLSGYGWENAGCNLMALHAYITASGDWDFAESLLPQLEKVIRYNLSLDTDGDGILEAVYHGNDMHGEITSLNWWDAFAFGHKDAYANLVFYQAFQRLLPILQELGATDLSTEIETFLKKFSNAFHDCFYNADTGVYAGWISKDGTVHDYKFTFITAMAINAGLVEQSAGQKMLQVLLDQLDESSYGAYRFGVPGPSIPVDIDDRSDWAPMSDWGRYENGGFCGQTAYHFILALYNCDMREEADKILFTMLDTYENIPTHSGLNTRFGHSVDWRTKDGQPCGYNYLADNYVFVLAAIQGHFGIAIPELPERK